MTAIERLTVIWGDPHQGNRHTIGHLARSGGQYQFWYMRDLSSAFKAGFRLLLEFDEHRGEDRPYVERYLFAPFAERIPAPSRPDASAMMQSWGVEHPDDPFEVLARSGGIRATDRIELTEYRADDDDLGRPLEFRVASRSHMTAPAALAVGDVVSLRREPTNEADPQAVVVDRLGNPAGSVPRQYTALFGRLLDRGVPLHGQVVRRLIVPDEVGKWVARIERRPS